MESDIIEAVLTAILQLCGNEQTGERSATEHVSFWTQVTPNIMSAAALSRNDHQDSRESRWFFFDNLEVGSFTLNLDEWYSVQHRRCLPLLSLLVRVAYSLSIQLNH